MLKPRKLNRFDYNLIIIGGGAAGLVTANLATSVGAKVLLIERDHMGGDCLNHGCVPSKALLKTAKILSYTKRSSNYGISSLSAQFSFAEIMQRNQRVIQRIAPQDSMERYRALGVDCVAGEAVLEGPHQVRVNEQVFRGRRLVLATGAKPLIPDLPGLADIPYLTSENLWDLREPPRRLLILGGGPMGCEMSQAFARLGVPVTLVQKAERLLPNEDEEFSFQLAEILKEEGVDLRLGHLTQQVTSNGLVALHHGQEVVLPFSHLLLATGKAPSFEGLGLEKAGVQLSQTGALILDDSLRTTAPSIYACGDAAGPFRFTHAAAHQAWQVALNALFAPWYRRKIQYQAMPHCTFVDPELARVGLNEQEAKAQGIPYEVTRLPLAEVDRAICEGETQGQIKILTPPGKDQILGVTLLAPHAGELISEFSLAMTANVGLNKILKTIHPYPTFAEVAPKAAGRWKRNHAPHWALPLLSYIFQRNRK